MKPKAQPSKIPQRPDSAIEDADALLCADDSANLAKTEAFTHSGDDKQDTKPPGSNLEQTEAFSMNPHEDDAAADFLLDREGDEATQMLEAPRARAKPAATSALAATTPLDHVPAKGDGGEADSGEADSGEAEDDAETGEKTEVTDPDLAPARAASAAARPTMLGDYKLIKKLGQGGMGSVFKALNTKLDKVVAVKVLSKELAAKPAFVARFQREARLMAKLDHPNILRCFDVDSVQGHHFLAMEYVDGGSIEGWFKKLGRFELGDALYIILTVAAALQHAHELKLVHRDVKADNILLTSKGVIKVADLGLAKATDEDMGLTKTGTGAGTPFYMAPEQARDVKHVDGRVDIYALGIMLYLFLTGELPFKGATIVEMIEAKEKGKFAPIRKLNAEVPDRLDLIVGKMLAVKPEHRYASCAAVIADIEALGLANDRLSFLDAPTGQGAVGKAAPQKTSLPAGKGASMTSSPAAQPAKDEAPAGNAWYWTFQSDDGRKVTKKLTKDKMIALIKSGAIDTDAQVSRQPKTGFRAIGTYGDFLAHLQKNILTEKVEQKGSKYREMYKQIVAEEESRQRWRWFNNLMLKVGGGVGLIIWLCVVAAVLVGGYFVVRWALEYFGLTVAEKAGLK